MMILLYISTIIPGYKLAFYLLISLIPGIVVIEYGIKQCIIFIVASFILSLVMPGDKMTLLLFYSFFGIYAVIKYLIEKIKSKVIILIVKLVYFIGIFFLNMYFATKIAGILPEIMLKYNMWLVFAAAIIVFVIYDIMYTSFSQFYLNKIKKHVD
jgi:hypothetical protein